MALTETDKRAIRAFSERRAATSKHLAINYTESARIGGFSTLSEAKRAAESTIIGGK